MISVSDLMLYGIRISQYLEIPHNTLLCYDKNFSFIHKPTLINGKKNDYFAVSPRDKSYLKKKEIYKKRTIKE